MISEEKVLTYSDELIAIFNLKTGQIVKRYFIPEYSIVGFIKIDEDGNYLFQTNGKNEKYYCFSIFKTNLENDGSSTLYKYSQDHYNCDSTKFDSCYFICEKSFFHLLVSYTPYAYILTPD
jgi:hypothetical protein